MATSPMNTALDGNHPTHWDRVYAEKDSESLGWYEPSPQTTLELLRQCHLPHSAQILIAGAGTTTLVDHLLDLGYTGLIAADLSAVALEKLQQRLGERASRLQWVVDDLSASKQLGAYQGQLDLWQDRAVLHFLLTDAEREGYLQSLKKLLKPGGFALIACFAPGTAERCSGLPIRQYSAADLAEWLGPSFELTTHQLQTYTMPSGGQREFTHALFKRHE
ncbi:MAG: class I SAM-dependent methyltransferase [Candidatus Sericytochromatia bacterium]|nr:class I SAM-dependent methyltransferase [Candidatus Sericytochromatia bacterium]